MTLSILVLATMAMRAGVMIWDCIAALCMSLCKRGLAALPRLDLRRPARRPLLRRARARDQAGRSAGGRAEVGAPAGCPRALGTGGCSLGDLLTLLGVCRPLTGPCSVRGSLAGCTDCGSGLHCRSGIRRGLWLPLWRVAGQLHLLAPASRGHSPRRRATNAPAPCRPG